MRLSRRIPSGREHGLSGFRLAAAGSLAAPDFPMMGAWRLCY